MSYTMETKVEIWNDRDGTRIEIGPDRDGLDLFEFRAYDEKDGCLASITFTREEAHLVYRALEKLLGDKR